MAAQSECDVSWHMFPWINVGFLIFTSDHWSTGGSRGTRWQSWLRHCATSQKVMGSIPDGVIGIFHCHNPSSRSMALRLTQSVTKMSKGQAAVKFTLEQATKAQRGSRGIALHFL